MKTDFVFLFIITTTTTTNSSNIFILIFCSSTSSNYSCYLRTYLDASSVGRYLADLPFPSTFILSQLYLLRTKLCELPHNILKVVLLFFSENTYLFFNMMWANLLCYICCVDYVNISIKLEDLVNLWQYSFISGVRLLKGNEWVSIKLVIILYLQTNCMRGLSWPSLWPSTSKLPKFRIFSIISTIYFAVNNTLIYILFDDQVCYDQKPSSHFIGA